MTSRSRSLFVALAVLSLVPRGVRSQVRLDDRLPRQLVEGLFGFMSGGREFGILVGKIPPGFPVSLAPAGLPVLGGMNGFGGVVAVFTSDETPAAAQVRYQAALESLGFAATAVELGNEHGFVSTQSVPEWTVRCKGDTAVQVSPLARDGDGTLLRVSFQARAGGLCTPRGIRGNMWRESRIPALLPPPGARGEGGGSSSSGDSWSSNARLWTKLGLDEVIRHYDDQMLAAGWTRTSRATSDVSALLTYRLLDKNGTPTVGSLTLIRADAADRLLLSVSASRP